MALHTDDLDQLLKARSEIDEELRRHKAKVTVLFTDVVGSTGYFDRYGDTAGLLLLHRHDHLVTAAVEEFQGIVIKTIGDSVMAEFPEPQLAVLAGIEIQRCLFEHNQSRAESERLQVRAGINSGVGFRRGNDLFGDAVNVAARLTKHSGPAQILVSQSVWEATLDSDIWYKPIPRANLEGKAEAEEVYEVVWTDSGVYEQLRANIGAVCSDSKVDQFIQTPALGAASADTSWNALADTHAITSLSRRYEILDRVGVGGMGVVFKARDRETGEIVALKVLKREIAVSAPLMDAFRNELRLARKITHKNVCRIYDFTRSEDIAFISMEFVEGESIRQVLARFGALGFRKGLKIAQQMCDGLREAHAQGIVHRDLKPENFMIDEFGNVKLMDFGLAHLLREGSTSPVGTPSYMAPELARGEPFDQRADIYALGLVLFEIFTGVAAFTGETPMLIALKQSQEAPPDPRDIENMLPDYVGAAILRCLEKDPSKRFQSVEELRGALLNEPARPIKTSRRMRRRVLDVVGLVVIAAALITGGIAFSRKTETEAELAAFRLAQFSGTETAWKKFLETHREGQLVSAAQDRLLQLRAQAEENAKAASEPDAAANASPQGTVPADTLRATPSRTIPRSPQPQPTAIDQTKTGEKKPHETWTALNETVMIPAAVFMMGNDAGRRDEKPAHQVRVDSFRMSRTEITNRQYLTFLEETGHPRPKDPVFAKQYLTDYPGLPVVNVSYQDAIDFCKWVSRKFAVSARLPSEAEWEYAVSGGQPAVLSLLARYKGNSGGAVPTVGRAAFPPNGFGLYNMSRNVWEWVSDYYSKDYYQISPIRNPAGPKNGTKRVIRGGSWADDETQLWSYRRASRDPNDRNDQIGFRIVIESRGRPREGRK